MVHRKSTTLQLAASLLCGLATAAFAQQLPGPPPFPVAQPPQTAPNPSTPTLKVKAKLTVEDVTVTDAKDKPVHGLMQPDFTVKEDGKVQTIKNFGEYGATAEQAPPQLPPGIYSNRQAAAPSAVNILLFDDVTTGLESVMYERLQAIKYLSTIPPGSQVAILHLTNGLRIVQGFTSDQNVLRAGIDSVRPDLVAGASLEPREPGDPPPPQIVKCAVQNRTSDLTTSALAAVAGFVSGIKGRKNLIWFTGGISWLTDYGLFSHVGCVRDYSSQLHNDYNLLNAAQVAIYPVSLSEAPPNTSMWDIADATGGVAYSGRTWLDVALKEAITNGTNYYSLSYVPPPSKYDGKYHTIDVKVDRPGLQLHYREGYTALDAVQPQPDAKNSGKPAAQPVSAIEQSASQFHAAMKYGPDGNDLTFDVHVQPSAAASKPGESSPQTLRESLNPKLKGQPLTRYDLEYSIPAGEITLPASGPSGTQTASAQFAVAVFSADGELLNAAGRTVVFPVKQDQAAQFMNQPSRMSVQVDLPPGKVVVRVGLFDVASQRWGTLEIPDAAAPK